MEIVFPSRKSLRVTERNNATSQQGIPPRIEQLLKFKANKAVKEGKVPKTDLLPATFKEFGDYYKKLQIEAAEGKVIIQQPRSVIIDENNSSAANIANLQNDKQASKVKNVLSGSFDSFTSITTVGSNQFQSKISSNKPLIKVNKSLMAEEFSKIEPLKEKRIKKQSNAPKVSNYSSIGIFAADTSTSATTTTSEFTSQSPTTWDELAIVECLNDALESFESNTDTLLVNMESQPISPIVNAQKSHCDNIPFNEAEQMHSEHVLDKFESTVTTTATATATIEVSSPVSSEFSIHVSIAGLFLKLLTAFVIIQLVFIAYISISSKFESVNMFEKLHFDNQKVYSSLPIPPFDFQYTKINVLKNFCYPNESIFINNWQPDHTIQELDSVTFIEPPKILQAISEALVDNEVKHFNNLESYSEFKTYMQTNIVYMNLDFIYCLSVSIAGVFAIVYVLTYKENEINFDEETNEKYKYTESEDVNYKQN